MAERPMTVLIAGGQPVFRSGLRNLLQADDAFMLAGEGADGEQAVAIARQLKPDVLLLDLQIPKLNAMQVLEALTESTETTRILLMADAIERQQLIRALRCGARGVITKDAESAVFLKALRCVHKGELWVERDVLTEWALETDRAARANTRLTAREREIVREILAGSSNREIAAKFAITEHTVKRHLTNIYDKLGCSTRLELSLYAMYHHF